MSVALLAFCIILPSGSRLFAESEMPSEGSPEESPSPSVAAGEFSAREMQQKFSQLRHGMNFREVVGLFGAPTDRKELEVKRETIWFYGASRIFFSQGKVVAWLVTPDQNAGAAATTVDAPAPKATSDADKSPKRGATDDATIRSLLGEIMTATNPSASSNPVPPAAEANPPVGVPRPIEENLDN